MLVLSRRETERIRLGDSIVVTVVRIAGDRVRLGIEAPADMLVLRDELDELPPSAAANRGGPTISGGQDAARGAGINSIGASNATASLSALPAARPTS